MAVTAVNTIIERMCDLIMLMHAQGKDWAIENPVQRSDTSRFWKRYLSAKFKMHGQMPCIVELMRVTGAVAVNVPMCLFDPDGPQKYTTVLISKSLAPAASALTRACCSHDKHKTIAVGLEHSRASQVYSSPFCETWARVMRWTDDAGTCSQRFCHTWHCVQRRHRRQTCQSYLLMSTLQCRCLWRIRRVHRCTAAQACRRYRRMRCIDIVAFTRVGRADTGRLLCAGLTRHAPVAGG